MENYKEEYKKVVRDPIYGYIGLTEEQLEVVNLPVFQRLRRISQLSFADMVYPNATHNRFSHSLGVMHLARMLRDHLRLSGIGKQINLDENDYEAIVWAGLLHDIGHLPFSHVSEPIFAYFMDKKDEWKDYHVDIGIKIIKDPEFGISDILGEDIANKVCNLIKGKATKIHPLLKETMTGLCSIDRLDYLKRDAYHAGVPEYAIIDAERIINSLTFYPEAPDDWNPVFKKKSLYALEGIVLSYFFMYKAVYYHHAVRAAYLLFQDIIWKAFEQGCFEEFGSELLTPKVWNNFDDHNFSTLLRNCDKTFSIGLNQVIFRHLPKKVSIPPELKPIITRIVAFIENSSFKDKVQKTEVIKKELNRYNIKNIILDAPALVPYPPSLLYSEKAIFVWEEEEMHTPEDISSDRFSPYLKNLKPTADTQLKAKVYVYPEDLRTNKNFIKSLCKVIKNILE